MRLEDLPGRLEEIKEKIIEQGRTRVLIAGATAMRGEMADRIFHRGQAADGSQMSDYSTEPAYYSKEDFVRKAAFKPTKKGAKTMYLKEGYKEFRGIQGRPTDKKNFKLTGSLERSIQVVQKDNETVIAITDAKESDKRKGLEKQENKKVFKGSKSDFRVFKEAIGNEIDHLRNNL